MAVYQNLRKRFGMPLWDLIDALTVAGHVESPSGPERRNAVPAQVSSIDRRFHFRNAEIDLDGLPATLPRVSAWR